MADRYHFFKMCVVTVNTWSHNTTGWYKVSDANGGMLTSFPRLENELCSKQCFYVYFEAIGFAKLVWNEISSNNLSMLGYC